MEFRTGRFAAGDGCSYTFAGNVGMQHCCPSVCTLGNQGR